MRVIESWDTQYSFWKLNPQLLVPQVYQDLYKEDKSRDKHESSKIMWAIAFLIDYDSKYRQLELNQRKELIARDFLKNSKFDWKKYQKHIDVWELFKSITQKQAEQWERIMNEKRVFLDNLPFNAENCKLVEDLMLSTEKLNKVYDTILEKLAQEGNQGSVLGGGLESFLEKTND